MNNIVHFEELWNMAEKASSKQNSSDMELIGKISSAIDEISDIYKVSGKSNDKALVQGIKSKAIGRLLMTLAALSNKEGIDVYSAMKDQLDVIKLKEKAIF